MKKIPHISGQSEPSIVSSGVDRVNPRNGIRTGSLEGSLFIDRFTSIKELDSAASNKNSRARDMTSSGFQDVESTCCYRVMIFEQAFMAGRRTSSQMKYQLRFVRRDQPFDFNEISYMN